MQVTLTIPDELAAELIAAGRDPSRTAIEALTAYQRLLDLASEADEQEGLRQALEDVAAGRTYPAEEVFAAMRSKHGIPG
jgi:predicted transcriptional regulator